jgi:hypothetical protein
MGFAIGNCRWRKAAADIELARHWNPGTIGKAPPRKASGSKFGQ